MRRIAFVATFALAALAGCGSNSSSSATTAADSVVVTDPATVEETVVEETVVEETVVDGTDTTMSGSAEGADTEFCAINQELNDTEIPLEGTPADLEAYFTGFFPDALGRLEGAVPSELASDVDTLIDGVSQIGALLEANDWNAATAFADPAFAELATNPDFETAGNRVDAYCGV